MSGTSTVQKRGPGRGAFRNGSYISCHFSYPRHVASRRRRFKFITRLRHIPSPEKRQWNELSNPPFSSPANSRLQIDRWMNSSLLPLLRALQSSVPRRDNASPTLLRETRMGTFKIGLTCPARGRPLARTILPEILLGIQVIILIKTKQFPGIIFFN